MKMQYSRFFFSDINFHLCRSKIRDECCAYKSIIYILPVSNLSVYVIVLNYEDWILKSLYILVYFIIIIFRKEKQVKNLLTFVMSSAIFQVLNLLHLCNG